MSATQAQAKREIMSAVSVLQKFAKTGKVGATEPMDAKKKQKKATGAGKPKRAPAKGGKKPAAKPKKTQKKAPKK